MNYIHGNDLGGSEYDIYNTGSSTINAYCNFWDDSTATDIDQHIYDDDESAYPAVLFDPWSEPGWIFQDDFECGDTGSWSLVISS
jgi:hypothetical protein